TAALAAIGQSIAQSCHILEMSDDWDGEGSRGYRQETWTRAISFVRASAEAYMRLTSRPLPAPRISHGPDSSIDILWRSGAREVLINVPDSPDEPADFYGDDGPQHTETIKGIFNPASPNVWLLIWL